MRASNQDIAALLREAAGLLEARGDSPFRVAAYRRAANTAGGCAQPLHEIFERHGSGGLQRLAGIGPGIAAAIAEILLGGRWPRLERLRRAHAMENARELVVSVIDDEGCEQQCVVIDTRPKIKPWFLPKES